jgi:hypothetical protein
MAAKITILCASYKRYKEINVLLNSFICQTVDNWNLIVMHDGPDPRMKEIVGEYSKNYPQISYIESSVRANDYGHSFRDEGIKLVDTEYLMFTNDDNYYTPKFLEYMIDAVEKKGFDFVLCNFISHYNNPGIYIQEDYNVLNAFPRKNYIDMGAFILRTAFAREIGFKSRAFAADGDFVDELMKRFSGKIKVGKINKVLFVHN